MERKAQPSSQWRLLRRIRDCSPSSASKAEALAEGAEREFSVSRSALSRLVQTGVEDAGAVVERFMIFNICYRVCF